MFKKFFKNYFLIALLLIMAIGINLFGQKIINWYADITYNLCAAANFRLAGCDKFLTTNLSQQIVMENQNIINYSWKFTTSQEMIPGRVGCYFNPSGWIEGFKTLFLKCNEYQTNFHPGGVLKWFKDADLPKLTSIENSYKILINTFKQSESFVKSQIQTKKYPDLKILPPKLISSYVAFAIETWFDKQIVIKGETLTVFWKADGAKSCTWQTDDDPRSENIPTKGYKNLIINNNIKIKITCYNSDRSYFRISNHQINLNERFTNETGGQSKLNAQNHYPTINRVQLSIINNGDVAATAVELRYVPALNFYPLHIAGVFISTADAQLHARSSEAQEKASKQVENWIKEGSIGIPWGDPNGYMRFAQEIQKKYKEALEFYSGQKETGQTSEKGLFNARKYMKNINNANVQKYCLENFFHWDKTEIAKRENFCSAASVIASTILQGRVIGIPGMESCVGGNQRDWNAPCDGQVTFPRFNQRWQEWVLNYFERSFPKPQEGLLTIPFGPYITEMLDGTSGTYPIEVDQIELVDARGIKINSLPSVDKINPGQTIIQDVYLKLPICEGRRGKICEIKDTHFGYWVVLPWGNEGRDKNIWDNFYYKVRVNSVKALIKDTLAWLKKNQLTKDSWDALTYSFDTAFTVDANMPFLRYED